MSTHILLFSCLKYKPTTVIKTLQQIFLSLFPSSFCLISFLSLSLLISFSRCFFHSLSRFISSFSAYFFFLSLFFPSLLILFFLCLSLFLSFSFRPFLPSFTHVERGQKSWNIEQHFPLRSHSLGLFCVCVS